VATEEGAPAVFISFVHEDQEVVAVVKEFIEHELKLEKNVFLSSDKHQVFAGDKWLDKIGHSLEGARVVVLMLSTRSVRRPWVNFEAGGAWFAGKTIIPCCYGSLTKDHLPHPYSAIQALNLRDEAHYLVSSIHHHLGLKTPSPETPWMKALWGLLEEQKAEKEKKETGFIDVIMKDYYDFYRRLRAVLDRFTDEN